MRLRSHLLMLVAGAMLPVLALTAYLAFLLVEHEKETFRRGAMDRNRTFMTAIDSELHGHIRSLEVLAAAPALSREDLESIAGQREKFIARLRERYGLRRAAGRAGARRVAGRAAQGQSVQGVKETLAMKRLVRVVLFFAAVARSLRG
jgi:hypothetical protein